MLISNSKRVIYFHIPKCGGTSISKILITSLAWNDIIIGGPPIGQAFEGIWSRHFGLRKHSTPPTVENIIGKSTFQGFDKFTIVRNPCHRFISSFSFASQCLRNINEFPWIKRSAQCLSDDIKNIF